jgi:hypothetical protein
MPELNSHETVLHEINRAANCYLFEQNCVKIAARVLDELSMMSRDSIEIGWGNFHFLKRKRRLKRAKSTKNFHVELGWWNWNENWWWFFVWLSGNRSKDLEDFSSSSIITKHHPVTFNSK